MRVPARANLPVYSLIAAGLAIAAILALIFTHGDKGPTGALLVTVLIANLPGMLAAVYSERNNRDTRNGVMEAKMQAAAHLAIEEKSEDLEALVIRAVQDAHGMTNPEMRAHRAAVSGRPQRRGSGGADR